MIQLVRLPQDVEHKMKQRKPKIIYRTEEEEAKIEEKLNRENLDNV